MKKTLAGFLALVMLAGTGGCATVKKKFTRKKQERIIQPVAYTEQTYQKAYSSSYYYNSHYTSWKVWHEDLLKALDGNAKKRDRAAEEVLQHLSEMQAYLNEEKAAQLAAEADHVKQAVAEINRPRLGPNLSQIERSLERSLRVISSSYAPSDMSEFIRSDEIEL